MKNSKSVDVLADPEIQRHTGRILALREEERLTRGKLGGIIAAIGAELIAVKEALDRLSDKTAWLRWLKDHVHDSADTAQRYMRVARFSQKNRNAAVFFDLDPSVVYAALHARHAGAGAATADGFAASFDLSAMPDWAVLWQRLPGELQRRAFAEGTRAQYRSILRGFYHWPVSRLEPSGQTFRLIRPGHGQPRQESEPLTSGVCPDVTTDGASKPLDLNQNANGRRESLAPAAAQG